MSDPLRSGPSALQTALAAQAHAEETAQALSGSELRYRRLFESARDGILILDSQTGRISDSNPFMTELLGYTKKEFLGKELWEIGLLRDKATSQEAFRQLQVATYIRYEDIPLKTTRGEQRDVEFVSNLYRENGHTVIQCNIRDITARKAAERIMRQSEARFRQLANVVPNILWTAGVDGSRDYFNRRWYDYSGRTFEESKAFGWQSAVHEDDLPVMLPSYYAAVKERTDFECAYRLRRSDGVFRVHLEKAVPVCDEAGAVLKWVGTCTDIAERKTAELVLANAAEKNQQIAETLQRSMLQVPPPGRFPGLAVETLYVAAMIESKVGGDFFDAFALTEEKIALVVGDVSGKGLLAAGRTAEVKYALRAFLHAYASPEVALTYLNEFIHSTHHLETDSEETFIVIALAVVDTVTGQAVFSAAGAEPTLILRTGGQAERFPLFGMPLGVAPNSVYLSGATVLAVGETIIMATDGITEARWGRQFLGSEGMAALAEDAGPSMPLSQMCAVIHAGAVAFAGGSLRDDACLLLARRM